MRPPLNAGENRTARRIRRARRRCFNEAPAERGGKRRAPRAADVGRAAASMRPPLNAGENARQPPAAPPGGGASMRPPLNAGENAAGVVASASE